MIVCGTITRLCGQQKNAWSMSFMAMATDLLHDNVESLETTSLSDEWRECTSCILMYPWRHEDGSIKKRWRCPPREAADRATDQALTWPQDQTRTWSSRALSNCLVGAAQPWTTKHNYHSSVPKRKTMVHHFIPCQSHTFVFKKVQLRYSTPKDYDLLISNSVDQCETLIL